MISHAEIVQVSKPIARKIFRYHGKVQSEHAFGVDPGVFTFH